MVVLPIRIKYALNVAVQCPHDADPGEHRRAARCRHQDQGFHCRLPLRGFVLGLRKLDDVIAGILERHELVTARQRYRIVKPSLPPTISHRLRPARAASSS
jgi:hypothetical protein